ncbi:MAG TPA: Asp-tRNA(Asn)/Glu-tRNA(Gln) amidotransferase subunit GatB [Tissierellaceae bacterium]|nr:Asp-tRNA(Asn)/Glu-tRNA(Gln) amidotransferase subunit GatB [Tissierellaceae bacterium]
MRYKTIIGLEIHVELMTNTKIFCSCTNEFGGEANTHCCPICLGLPGVMPVLNRQVVEYGMKAGLAFNSKINRISKMDRKHYFYSDLVKGYQTSQEDQPLCEGGYIEIELENKSKKLHLERIHIEEDTGKSIHTETGDTLLDYNRAGVPLIEIVTKPEMNSAEEARLFLEQLRDTLKYIGVSDVRMEEGSLRCDININMVDEDSGEKTTITEIKNLNSFSAAVKSIEYEEERHKNLLKEKEDTEKETRRWDEVEGQTIIMRDKGSAEDYRFLPDGDVLPIKVDEEWIEEVRKSLPELPHHKKERFIKEYELTPYDAGVLTQFKDVSIFFEDTVKHINDSNLVSNWIMGDVLRRLNQENLEIDSLKFTSKNLADLLLLVKEEKINNNTGKKVLREMFETGVDPNTIVKEKGLVQISDENELENIVTEVLDENQQSIIDIKNGKDRAIGYLVGQVMKATKGQANPQMVNKMIMEMIEDR